jgi:predicted NAD-dependent protein-ADP-ribosyltransferase YbiA (DUF1768 family)
VNDSIRFYHVNAEYGCFSNFSPHPILLKGKQWPTSERSGKNRLGQVLMQVREVLRLSP